MSELTDLAERCEKADGPDRELDHAIAEQLGWTQRRLGQVYAWFSPDNPDRMQAVPPKWTASLDAAMSLVPEGSSWHLRWWSGDKNCWCTFYPPGDDENDYFHIYDAATPALALCAAALRAKDQNDE